MIECVRDIKETITTATSVSDSRRSLGEPVFHGLRAAARCKQQLKRRLRAMLSGVYSSTVGWLHWQVAGAAARRELNLLLRCAKTRQFPAGNSASARREGGLRLLFVAPWFGEGITGGAENLVLGLVRGIQELRPEVSVEVATTTLKEFVADWNLQHHAEGTSIESGVRVRRFHPSFEDRAAFNVLNRTRLMGHGTDDLWKLAKSGANVARSPLSESAEYFYLKHMIVSPGLLDFLARSRDDYDFFVFIPYMFAPSVLGSRIAPDKSILIPCLHDERYAFMKTIRDSLSGARACFFNAKAEKRFAERLTGNQLRSGHYIGTRVETSVPAGSVVRFREKFGIQDPFILYAGRQISGKNVPMLVEYHQEFLRRNPESSLKLVMIGRGDLNYSGLKGIVDLGFVSDEDKADACRSALALCQPSLNESFSIVMMEAWLQETPCLVDWRCEVTRDHVIDSEGGYAFRHAQEFADNIRELIANPTLRDRMGKSGRKYVLDNFSPEIVVNRFVGALEGLTR